MLTAMLAGKAGRITAGETQESQRWRDVFRRSEDLLTAVFFGRFKYLSPDSLALLVAGLLGEAPGSLGGFKSIELWSRLDLSEANGAGQVEPDVMLGFDNADVIVEVKPPFGGVQYAEQWRRQISAYSHTVAIGDKGVPRRVCFLGLGRNTSATKALAAEDFAIDEACVLSLHCCEWDDVFAILKGLREQEQVSLSDLAVLDDWKSAFRLFGIQRSEFQWPALLAFSARHKVSLAALQVEAPDIA